MALEIIAITNIENQISRIQLIVEYPDVKIMF